MLQVLILVLVDHTLGEYIITIMIYGLTVLILVLVDHTLGVASTNATTTTNVVLILVLVDHTLGVTSINDKLLEIGLNPCFSGPYSRRITVQTNGTFEGS